MIPIMIIIIKKKIIIVIIMTVYSVKCSTALPAQKSITQGSEVSSGLQPPVCLVSRCNWFLRSDPVGGN